MWRRGMFQAKNANSIPSRQNPLNISCHTRSNEAKRTLDFIRPGYKPRSIFCAPPLFCSTGSTWNKVAYTVPSSYFFLTAPMSFKARSYGVSQAQQQSYPMLPVVPLYKGAPELLPGNDRNALLNTIAYFNRHEEHRSLFLRCEPFIILYDQFPKSKVHLLVLHRNPSYKSLKMLRKEERGHTELLCGMLTVGEHLKSALGKQYPRWSFISGFHAIPSLEPLHMHVMSLDLESPCLKKKKHYNSFSTPFFLEGKFVWKNFTAHGYLTLLREEKIPYYHELESGPMVCLWCEQPLSNMPDMKDHVPRCKKNKSIRGPDT